MNKKVGKSIRNESFETLKERGHVVPRTKGGYIETFRVGWEGLVYNEDKSESVWVRCTQDCPHNLVTI